jgi:hypothetical protein
MIGPSRLPGYGKKMGMANKILATILLSAAFLFGLFLLGQLTGLILILLGIDLLPSAAPTSRFLLVL